MRSDLSLLHYTWKLAEDRSATEILPKTPALQAFNFMFNFKHNGMSIPTQQSTKVHAQL